MHGRIGSVALQHRDKKQIVITCQVLAEMGFGITRRLVKRVVAECVRENGIEIHLLMVLREWTGGNSL